MRWCIAHYLFSIFTITLVFCALFVLYFYYYVGVLRNICFLLLLLRWCVAQHLFSAFANTLTCGHYFFSTLSITWVFCTLIVFYFYYYVGVFALFDFYSYYYVSVLRTIFFYFYYYVGVLCTFFSTLTITLVFCALFAFYFLYNVGVLRTICFLL